MGFILGRVSFEGRPVDAAAFARAFDALRPGRCARSDSLVAGASGYGHHAMGMGGAPATQPLQEGALTLLADARLYNRADLARALGGAGPSDARLILDAYRRWGPECLARMNGDFGFAIHDRDRGEIFLARDHIGARPLFWTRRGDTVIFATLLPGMVAFDDFDWPLDELRIARHLRNPHEFLLESFVAGVENVGPGHWVRITRAGVTRQRWWDPGAIAQRSGITRAAAHEELRALTDAAVRARLPADAAVGAHFSGGIDSTLVTTLAARQLHDQGRALTAAYTWSPPLDAAYPDMGDRDERRVIAAQCAALDVPARFGASSAQDYEALAARPMELQGTVDLIDELPVLDQARTDGLGVMLSGWGADEVFSSHGAGHLAWMLRRGKLRTLLRMVRRHGGGPRQVPAFVWNKAVVPLLPDALYRRFDPITHLYSAGAFPSQAMKEQAARYAGKPAIRLRGDADAFMRNVVLNGHIGERMASWAAWSAPHGFEYRYPLTDRRVMEFVLSLPPVIRFGDGLPRALIRGSFRDVLPEGVKKADVANEKKRQDDRMAWWRSLARDADAGRFDPDCPWLDMPALRAAIRQPPPEEAMARIKTFARMVEAIRIHEMYRRQKAGCRARGPASADRP